MEKIVEGVYIQTIENKKVVQKYVPLSSILLNDNITLGEYINSLEAKFQAKNEEIKQLKEENEEIRANHKRLEKVFEDTIRGFVTK